MSAKPKPPGKNPDPLNVREVLAFQIRSRRVTKGWSQERLAFEAELDRTYVSAVERCTWNVSLSNIEKLALALEVKPFELLMPPDITMKLPSASHEQHQVLSFIPVKA